MKVATCRGRTKRKYGNFPLPRREASAHSPPMEQAQTSSPFALKGRKVLVVDDDRMNLRILGGILRADGYVIAEAEWMGRYSAVPANVT